jgi:ketosteroid isomerase-like protein
VTAPIANPADFAALDPFFRIIEQGLDGLAGPGHFFDLLAEDITIDYAVTVPGYPRHIEGRAAVAELYRPYGTMIILDRCFDLAVHHDATKGVVVLDYASEGHVVGTGRRYANRYISVLTLREARSRTGGTTSTRWLYSTRSAGRHADLPPAMLVMRHGKQGNAAGLSRKSTEHK